MRIYLYLLAFIPVLSACGSADKVLPKEKMEKVLWDVAQSNEFLNGFVYFRNPGQNRAALNNLMLDTVFKIHKITRAQFNNTLKYYETRPDVLQQIADTIIARKKRELGRDTSSTTAPINKDGVRTL